MVHVGLMERRISGEPGIGSAAHFRFDGCGRRSLSFRAGFAPLGSMLRNRPDNTQNDTVLF